MIIVPFSPIHLKHIDLQDDQAGMIEHFEDEDYIALLMAGEAYTAIEDGSIVCIAGAFPLTDYMAKGWALVSKTVGRSLLRATREIGGFFDKSAYDRIETPVRRDFINGHRWCACLGMVKETNENGMRLYGFDGETYDLYAMYPGEKGHGRTQSI